MTVSDALTLARWKTARRVTLGAILLAGSMAASAAAVQRSCVRQQRAPRVVQEVYSGVGVTITPRGGEVFISEVNPEGPSAELLYPGARLLYVDKVRPGSIYGWREAMRGEPGTAVELDVEYPCGGHQRVVIEREVIHVAR